jgi:hypothetical protein
LAAKVLAQALDYLNEQGYELGIGVTNSKVVLDHILPQFKHAQLDVSIQGQTSVSKPTDKAVFFPIDMSEAVFAEIIKKASIVKVIQVETEVF